jgi:hypothetical protein
MLIVSLAREYRKDPAAQIAVSNLSTLKRQPLAPGRG